MMRKHSSRIETGASSSCCGCCYCSKKVKIALCVLLWAVILTIVAIILAVIIKAATIQDPYVRLVLSDEEPKFMNATEEDILARSNRLVEAIAIKTISFSAEELSLEAMEVFGVYLETTFPLSHNSSAISFTPVNTHSRLYRVEGTEDTLNPYFLTAHMDVVPEGDLEKWAHDPFEAGIVTDDADGKQYIFGRGTMDDKHSVLAIMEVLEYRVKHKQMPKRTFYIGFGHDEEVSGYQGASEIAKVMRSELDSRGEELDFLLDEGMFVLQDVFPGVSDPLIYIGVAEKGWALVDLDVEGQQTHSSTPPRESSIGILAHGVANIEDNIQPSMFGTGPEVDTVRYGAPHANFLYKMALGNLWLFNEVIAMVFAASPDTDSVQRTTTAVTMIDAGVKENIVPPKAHAVINHRIHPSDSIEEVLERNRKNANDERVKITLRDYFPPTNIAPYENDVIPFQIIANSAMEVLPSAHPVPGLMVANTDTVHYGNLTQNIYRFTPVVNLPVDITRFHGIDERISVENYNQVVQFFYRMMENADQDIKSRPSPAEVLITPAVAPSEEVGESLGVNMTNDTVPAADYYEEENNLDYVEQNATDIITHVDHLVENSTINEL
eukprot:snap_masked-scaffold589_size129586-processed-gene-0.12 protein:Tk07342 transcript:snap_masked-scaffold589_size129586-processed-gene-0.12-mRNA-1 annotation:"carboxypeptidase pm20d1"